MSSLYIKLAGYLVAGIACVALGWHMGGLGPKKDLATLQAQDWQGKAQAAAAALVATQVQLKALQDTDARNAGVIKELNDENLKTAADRDHNAELYRRLFHASTRPPASGGPAVPEAQSGPAAADPGAAGSSTRVVILLTDLTAECERNADRLDALSAEVKSQL